MQNNSPLRLGILGCSDIARRKVIPALQGAAGVRLHAVASRSPVKAAAFAAGLDCRTHTYESLLSSPDIDLVYLSLPNHLHEEWTLAALEGGKHVICEKPLGLDPDSVGRMLAAADAKGLLLFENLAWLHHPQHQAAREHVPAIGGVRLLRTAFCFRLQDRENFRMDPRRGGGSFHDQARYPISAALHFLAAAPERFRGFALCREGLNVGMHGTAMTPAGEVFQFSIDFGLQYEAFYELVGTEGRIRVDRPYSTPPDMASRVRVLSGSRDRSFTVAPHDQFRLMVEHVGRLVREGGDFRAVHERSRRIAALAEAMLRGCEEREVT